MGLCGIAQISERRKNSPAIQVFRGANAVALRMNAYNARVSIELGWLDQQVDAFKI